MSDAPRPDVGLTKAISIIYLLLGGGLAVATFLGADMGGIRLDWKSDIWWPVLLVVAATGTLRRTKWGRWMSYLFSGFLLLGVPIGTFLGGYMLWHLTKYRGAFNRWY